MRPQDVAGRPFLERFHEGECPCEIREMHRRLGRSSAQGMNLNIPFTIRHRCFSCFLNLFKRCQSITAARHCSHHRWCDLDAFLEPQAIAVRELPSRERPPLSI
jgi:hypothetical protein